MNWIFVLIIWILNWGLKLIVAWAAYHFTFWFFHDPAEWAVITIVAVAAMKTNLNVSWTDDYGHQWKAGD